MIEMKDVTFRYGDENEDKGSGNATGVQHIELKVESGSCVVLCGRSGSGKSTILRLVSGLAPGFYSGNLFGKVSIDKRSPQDLLPEERTRLFGVVFQDPRSQFFMEKVRDELAFSAENLGLARDKIISQVEKQARLLGIDHLLNRSLNKLSSGQKQRVAIAAASVLSPPLLILDEPTANLDYRTTQTVIKILKKLKENGTTLVISEHRLHSLLSVADSFIYMEKGSIVQRWTQEAFANLNYEDLRPYGLRHPDMMNLTANRKYEESFSAEVELKGEKLTYHYKRNEDGIVNADMTLLRGSVIGLTGENGTGKTTLCKILCGLLRPSKGRILNSRGINLSAAQRRASSYFVMQDADYQLYADSVGNEIVLGKKLDDVLRSKASTALESFDLSVLRDRHPASLSGGEKQRVTLAAASCSNAELIVLDEPTSGLDGDGVIRVATWVRKLAQEGKTIVIITHDRILSHLACDQIKELKK